MIGSTYMTTPLDKKPVSTIAWLVILISIVIGFALLSSKQGSVPDTMTNKTNIEIMVDLINKNATIENFDIVIAGKFNNPDPNPDHEHIGLARASIPVSLPYHEDITLETFDNMEDLKLRKAFLQKQSDWIDATFPMDKYGDFLTPLTLPSRFTIKEFDHTLLILPKSLSKDIANMYTSIVKNAVEEVTFTSKNIPSNEDIEALTLRNDAVFESWSNTILATDIDKRIQEIKTTFNNEVQYAYASLDSQQVEKALEKLESYKAPIFEDEYKQWNNLLKEAKNCIKTSTISKGITDKRNEYITAIYPPETYQAGVNLLPGEYVLIGNGSYTCPNYRTYYYSNNEAIAVNTNTIITLKQGDSITTKSLTMYHIDNSPELPLHEFKMYKVGKHIPAGNYEFVSDKYGYTVYIINDTSLKNMLNIANSEDIIGKYITTTPSIVTLKEGQCVYIPYYNTTSIKRIN